jgi:hypothetical protein
MNPGIKYFGMLATAIAAVVGMATSAHADGVVSRADRNQTINIVYGKVALIEEATASSAAAGGAAVGGIVGLATQHGKRGGDKVAGAAGGALLGALLTRAAEGSRQLQAYTVRETDGSTVKIIQEPADIRVGDCVAVEQGSTSNVRRVAGDMCEAGPHLSDAAITASHAQDAGECFTAKRELLSANSDADVARAGTKVHILCF